MFWSQDLVVSATDEKAGDKANKTKLPLAARLIDALIGADWDFNIVEGDWNYRSNHDAETMKDVGASGTKKDTIWVSQTAGREGYFVKREGYANAGLKTGKIDARSLPFVEQVFAPGSDPKEQAFALAHELIHCYYHTGGGTWPSKHLDKGVKTVSYLFGNNRRQGDALGAWAYEMSNAGADLTTVRNEMLAIGLEVVTGKRGNALIVDSFKKAATGGFTVTENMIRSEMDAMYLRAGWHVPGSLVKDPVDVKDYTIGEVR